MSHANRPDLVGREVTDSAMEFLHVHPDIGLITVPEARHYDPQIPHDWYVWATLSGLPGNQTLTHTRVDPRCFDDIEQLKTTMRNKAIEDAREGRATYKPEDVPPASELTLSAVVQLSCSSVY